MGWLWSACAGLEPASPHYAMRCATSYTIGTISRNRGLSVVTRGEFTQRFRLSQAYAYIIPCFSAPKLAKFQKKKKLTAIRCRLPSSHLYLQEKSYALSSSALATRTSPHWHASSVAMCLNSCLMRYTVLSSIAQYTPVSIAL